MSHTDAQYSFEEIAPCALERARKYSRVNILKTSLQAGCRMDRKKNVIGNGAQAMLCPKVLLVDISFVLAMATYLALLTIF